jgi:peptidoglycan hydrolase-like protein with peptidoglycan-binding domain
MFKKTLIIGFGVALVAARFIASAATVSADSIVVTSTCPAFSHSLYMGISGSDVTALQEYLNVQGYLSVSATGYFGPLTQAAVARWQAQGGVVALGGVGSGTFGPLSRAYFARSCGGLGSGGAPQSTGFSANPPSGVAPLTVQFTSSASQGGTVGNSVNFGDGTSGNLGFVPVCSSCNLLGTVSHTYASSGTYTATLTSGVCSCPANGICNCPAMIILGTTTVTVAFTGGSSSSSSTASNIQQLNAPGSVILGVGGIAEIRNGSFYFTLATVTTSTATIHIMPVGCWNSFPSDPPRTIICMIAVVPTPPQTLSVGQEYTFGNYHITLTNISGSTATFSVQ